MNRRNSRDIAIYHSLDVCRSHERLLCSERWDTPMTKTHILFFIIMVQSPYQLHMQFIMVSDLSLAVERCHHRVGGAEGVYVVCRMAYGILGFLPGDLSQY